MKETAAVAASPASFQPLKAQTMIGLRSLGLPFQITSCILFTVPNVRAPHHDWHVATAERTTTIAELRPGAELDGVFACTRKDRLTARNGSAYLAVELRDRSGTIAGRAFRDADFLAAQFERGDLVAVSGRVERFREELQVELRSIRRTEAADPGAFLPTAYRDLEELDGFLEHLSREVYDPDLRTLLELLPGRSGAARRAAPRALHAGRAPRLPGRAARAHGGRGHAGARDLRPASPPQLRPADLRGDPARHGQDPRVRAGRRDRAQRGRRRWWGTWSSASS